MGRPAHGTNTNRQREGRENRASFQERGPDLEGVRRDRCGVIASHLAYGERGLVRRDLNVGLKQVVKARKVGESKIAS